MTRSSSCTGLVFLVSLMGGCGNESGSPPAAPAGTNQQDAVNSAGQPDSPAMMPGVGAPGSAGAGTQPGTSNTIDNTASARKQTLENRTSPTD